MAAEEITLEAVFTYLLYENGEYRICKYADTKPENGPKNFVAKGYNLPKTRNAEVELTGKWVNRNGDKTFSVSTFEEKKPTTEKGMIDYFKSLKCGIGKTIASRIYRTYGNKAWDVIDKDPERMIGEVKGISSKNLARMLESIKTSQLQSELIRFFNGEITMKKANQLASFYGGLVWEVVEKQPYDILRVPGFGFTTADNLAMRLGFTPDCVERRMASITAALDEEAKDGNVCVPQELLIQHMKKVLRKTRICDISDEMCEEAIRKALSLRFIRRTSGYIYTSGRYEEETGIVKHIFRLIKTAKGGKRDVSRLISQYERENEITFAESQRKAIQMVFDSPVSILTGGPGTGKSTVIKAILYCHKKIYSAESAPMLLSPTGKAARRMSEVTGMSASTIHSALGLFADKRDCADYGPLDANLIVVDETSMMDQFVAFKLLERVKNGTKLVLVGDPEQLPSVGCGNVLYELIRSEEIPTTRLSVIFRQEGTNPIIENSLKVLKGETDLIEDGKHFTVKECSDPLSVVKKAAGMYIKAIEKYGIENCILLCPYRKATGINVNLFNHNIQEYVNPAVEGEYTMKGQPINIGTMSVPLEFRKRDRVMQTVNHEGSKNGDVGYILDIVREIDTNDPTQYVYAAIIEFNGDGVEQKFYAEDMLELDLAYCTTVHKSQGSEYQSVIVVISGEHELMLKRNLFYTAITRARENVLIVGDRNAINTSIRNVDTRKRYTLLGDRIHSSAAKRRSKLH